MAGERLGMGALVARLGGHPAAESGLDLTAEGGPERWLVTACLLAERVGEERALAAARRLAEAGLDHPAAIARAGAAPVAAALEAAGHPRAEAVAGRLVRLGTSLADAHEGSLAALAAEAEGLEDLGSRLARLAPGVGAATVLRFLRPLRELWASAAETPLDPAARAAAVHLGWIAEGEDEDGAPGSLARARLREPGAPPLADLEAALARLGRRSCLRGRPDRCPLGEACPART